MTLSTQTHFLASSRLSLLNRNPYTIAFFVTCFFTGIVAGPAGIDGCSYHIYIDFVRGFNPLVALASALSAGPMLLRNGLASERLDLPLASIGTIAGAILGLTLPSLWVQMAHHS